jgi:hypothetical protein
MSGLSIIPRSNPVLLLGSGNNHRMVIRADPDHLHLSIE